VSAPWFSPNLFKPLPGFVPALNVGEVYPGRPRIAEVRAAKYFEIEERAPIADKSARFTGSL
jgi:hypothetical protein